MHIAYVNRGHSYEPVDTLSIKIGQSGLYSQSSALGGCHVAFYCINCSNSTWKNILRLGVIESPLCRGGKNS